MSGSSGGFGFVDVSGGYGFARLRRKRCGFVVLLIVLASERIE